MKKTVVLVSSNRQLEKQTQDTLRRFGRLGATTLLESGSPDVAFARCRALSFACSHLREFPEKDTVLMMDDDMEVADDTAQAVVDKSRELGIACAAVYSTLSAKIAASRWAERPGLWLSGLGLMAIPRALLLELEENSESFSIRGMHYSAFTWCGPQNGEWVAEDFRLSMRLGGVHLCPLGVGHIKKGALWPDDETLAKIAAGENLE